MRKHPRLSKNGFGILTHLLRKKAAQSSSKYRISAMAFDSRGEFLGQAFNGLPMDEMDVKEGSGVHAEARLMRKYGQVAKTIVISRIGHNGDWRPIQPCPKCQELARKLGIRLETIEECRT